MAGGASIFTTSWIPCYSDYASFCKILYKPFCLQPMTITVKNKTDLVVSASVRRRAGIKAVDRLEFKVSGGIINIIPKLPAADDEYTP